MILIGTISAPRAHCRAFLPDREFHVRRDDGIMCPMCGGSMTDPGYDLCEKCHAEEIEYANRLLGRDRDEENNREDQG